MSAVDFCKQVQQKKSALGEIGDVLKSISPFGIISAGLDKLGARNQTETVIKNNIENKVSMESRTLLNQSCETRTDYNQQNAIDNTACVKAFNCGRTDDILELKKAGMSDQAISELLADRNRLCGSILAGKVVQKNQLSSQQNCAVDNTLKLLSESNMDANLMAIFQKMQDAKGLLTSNNSKSSTCTNINNNASAQRYIDSYQKCSSALKLDQGNTAACAANVDQQNLGDMFDRCMIAQGVIDTATIKTVTNPTTDVKEQQKAEGLTPFMIFMILLLVLAVFGLVMYVKKMRSE
jgi:hypothetical protein